MMLFGNHIRINSFDFWHLIVDLGDEFVRLWNGVINYLDLEI